MPYKFKAQESRSIAPCQHYRPITRTDLDLSAEGVDVVRVKLRKRHASQRIHQEASCRSRNEAGSQTQYPRLSIASLVRLEAPWSAQSLLRSRQMAHKNSAPNLSLYANLNAPSINCTTRWCLGRCVPRLRATFRSLIYAGLDIYIYIYIYIYV